MDIEYKLADEELKELLIARAKDQERGLTAPIFVNSESDDIAGLRVYFKTVEDLIIRVCPDGRRKSIALTHLETAAMFAVKSAYEKYDG